MTMAESEFLKKALADLEGVTTERGLLDWDEFCSSQPEYLTVSPKAIMELEEAYDRKLRELTGWGAA